jgi:hypothetical protein
MAAKKMVNGSAYGGFHLDLSGKQLYMRNCILTVVMFLGSLAGFAQQDYFVYLQTDNRQAFFVRNHNKIYSSTASGYLIMSQLPDSVHHITIGFPQNAFPEQEFTLPQNRKDAGYLLKDFGSKGWGLFNLQTMAIIMSDNGQKEKKSLEIGGARKTDAFSVLLSNAVNDTAILYATHKPKPAAPVAAVKEEKKNDTPAIVRNNKEETITLQPDKVSKRDTASLVQKKPVPKKDSAAITKNTKANNKTTTPAKNNIPKNNTITATPQPTIDSAVVVKKADEPTKPLFTPPPVIKAAELRTDTSYIAVFIDEAKQNNDTVRISIPFDEVYTRQGKNPYLRKPATTTTEPQKEIAKEPVITTDKTAEKKDSSAFEKITQASKKDSVVPQEIVRTEPVQKEVEKKESEKKDPEKKQTITEPVTVTAATVKDTASIVKNIIEQPAVKKDSAALTPTDTAKSAGIKPILINSDCKATAWDSDIDKLRIKMLASNSDDEKIDIAKKLYRLKCFTVRQVRALSELFSTDQGKYKWLDAVYPFTTNSYYFSELEDLLKDEYFRNRFKAMIHH